MATATVSPRPASALPWLIIVCGCLIAALTFGPRSAMGFFQLPMLAEKGWDRTTFGLAMAIQLRSCKAPQQQGDALGAADQQGETQGEIEGAEPDPAEPAGQKRHAERRKRHTEKRHRERNRAVEAEHPRHSRRAARWRGCGRQYEGERKLGPKAETMSQQADQHRTGDHDGDGKQNGERRTAEHDPRAVDVTLHGDAFGLGSVHGEGVDDRLRFARLANPLGELAEEPLHAFTRRGRQSLPVPVDPLGRDVGLGPDDDAGPVEELRPVRAELLEEQLLLQLRRMALDGLGRQVAQHDEHACPLDVAEETGLDRTVAEAALADPRWTEMVRAEERMAWDMNVTGVPAMLVERKFMIPGAQAPEVYVDALRRVAERIQGRKRLFRRPSQYSTSARPRSERAGGRGSRPGDRRAGSVCGVAR